MSCQVLVALLFFGIDLRWVLRRNTRSFGLFENGKSTRIYLHKWNIMWAYSCHHMPPVCGANAPPQRASGRDFSLLPKVISRSVCGWPHGDEAEFSARSLPHAWSRSGYWFRFFSRAFVLVVCVILLSLAFMLPRGPCPLSYQHRCI